MTSSGATLVVANPGLTCASLLVLLVNDNNRSLHINIYLIILPITNIYKSKLKGLQRLHLVSCLAEGGDV